jgi:hypothetical protein
MLPLRYISEYFVKYQNMVLENQQMGLSMESVSWKIHGAGCVGSIYMDIAVAKPIT